MSSSENTTAPSLANSHKNHPVQNIYPWIVWGLAASFFFYKYLLQMSPSVMSHDLMRTYSINGAGLGNLAACFFYAYALMQIPVGILLDKWNPRIITLLALFVCVVGTFWFANATTLWTAELSRFVIGLGAAFAAVACFKLTSLWFPLKRFALVAGLSMTAAMLGALGGVAPLSWLVEQLGWRSAISVVAMIGLVLLLLMILIVRDRKGKAEHVVEQDDTPLFEKFKIIFKDKQTWLLSFYSGLAFAPVSVFGGLWGVSFIQQAHNLSPVRAATVVSMIFIGFAIGCPIAGWFSDFVQRRISIMFAGTLIAFITLSAVIYIPVLSELQLQILLFLFGLGASCFFLCFSMIREIHSLLFVGTVLGFMNTFDSICEAVTEPFVGKLLDMGWSGEMQNGAPLFSVYDYRLGLTTLPIYFFIGMILLFFTKETFCKQK